MIMVSCKPSRGRQWAHADLAGLWLDGADCEGINLFGARLVHTSFVRCNLKNATLAYAHIEGASFRHADLEGADLLYANVNRARFDGATIGPTSTNRACTLARGGSGKEMMKGELQQQARPAAFHLPLI
jgi:uncharacterized protein YjbI with pentapeptide repeats